MFFSSATAENFESEMDSKSDIVDVEAEFEMEDIGEETETTVLETDTRMETVCR